MALVPALWLLGRWEKRVEWRWLAGIFLVSWLADTVSHWTGTWFISAVYPVSQAALVGLVFLHRQDALLLTGTLVIVGLMTVLQHGVTTPEVLLHTVAWLTVVGIVYPLPLGPLRTMLLVAFGLGWLAYLGYVLRPGWTSWGLYQAVRAVSLGFFCWANVSPPRMRLA